MSFLDVSLSVPVLCPQAHLGLRQGALQAVRRLAAQHQQPRGAELSAGAGTQGQYNEGEEI